jgi:cob(I)alamin adenosyltransferase
MSSAFRDVSPVAGRIQRIFTRAGDRGQTRLLSGETLEKDDLRVNTYGALDELQSHLGMARALISEPTLRSMLYAIQKDLFVAGSELASTPTKLAQLKRRLTTEDISVLEAKMDQLAESYGIPGSFVLPGAAPDSAALHVARSVCRRVERLIVQLNRSTRSYQDLIVYFNRLSDLLFVMAWSATVNALAESILDELVARRR